MLGRQHISISLFTVLPFVIPFVFIQGGFLIFALIFLAAVFAGSMIPDADCGGNSILHYKVGFLDWIMKHIIMKIMVSFFNNKRVKRRIKLEVDHSHRGILHSPVGVFITSFLLTFSVFILFFIYQIITIDRLGLALLTNILFSKQLFILTALFLGLFIGQILHLMEDSCTKSGINWNFPFGYKVRKGMIYTYEKYKGRKDIRPALFSWMFAIISVLTFFGFLFDVDYGKNAIDFIGYILYKISTFGPNLINDSISSVTVFISIFIIVVSTWESVFIISKTNRRIWYWKKETVKKFK